MVVYTHGAGQGEKLDQFLFLSNSLICNQKYMILFIHYSILYLHLWKLYSNYMETFLLFTKMCLCPRNLTCYQILQNMKHTFGNFEILKKECFKSLRSSISQVSQSLALVISLRNPFSIGIHLTFVI